MFNYLGDDFVDNIAVSFSQIEAGLTGLLSAAGGKDDKVGPG